MRYRSRLVVMMLAAGALLVLAVSGASARSLSTNQRPFEVIWNEALGAPKTRLRFTAGGRRVACNVTMLGAFVERTIKKETATTQALFIHIEVGACVNGFVDFTTLPVSWPIRFRGFTGVLPRIRSKTLGSIGLKARITEAGGLACEAETEVNHPGVFIVGNSPQASETGFESTGEPENITAEEGNKIPLRGEGFLCALAGEGEIAGTGLMRNLPRTGKLRITLI